MRWDRKIGSTELSCVWLIGSLSFEYMNPISRGIRNLHMKGVKDFEKGSTVYLANVNRYLDSNGSVVLTVRRSEI